jgi:starch phosphorylase
VPQLGERLTLRAIVDLDGLAPSVVEVQAVYGIVDDNDEIVAPTVAPMGLVGDADGGLHRYETELSLQRTGPYGYSVRVLPIHPLLASPAELGLIATP